MYYAVIDLGTVTSRLLIAQCSKGRVQALRREIRITNLGEGLASSGRISNVASTRLLAALQEFKELALETKNLLMAAGVLVGELPVKIVTTSAMRDAANALEVLAALKGAGFTVEILSGNREAELAFKGALSGFSEQSGAVLSIDVGGGSTELVFGTASGVLHNTHSFDIGCRRITELFLLSDPPTPLQLAKARAWVKSGIEEYAAALPDTSYEVLAMAGTATTAITVREAMETYDASLVHAQRLTRVDLEELIERLAMQSLAERRKVVGLHPERAPVIVGGFIVLAAVLEVLQKDSLVVSDTDILQGIILDLAACQ